MASPPPAPVIVVACHKGGIGRTAVAVNLAAMLALAGHRTLLVDLDSKGDATASVGLSRAHRGKTLARMSEPWTFLKDTVSVRRPAGLDVWPGGPALDKLRSALRQETAQDDLLDRGLQLARQRYRAVVIDAPADLGPLSRNAFASGDVLLLPLAGTALAERALVDTVEAATRLQGSLRVYGVRSGLRDAELEHLDPNEPAAGPEGIQLLDSTLCYDPSTLNRAVAEGLPVFECDPRSRLARGFLELGREVVAKVVLPGREQA